ncbi:hypothetical protein J6P92_04385, partial [bacterium]|nr:hypothetical protein [bacterium]
MRVNGTQPNKFEVFQEFYYVVKGEEITYNQAVEMFFKMDNTTHTEFCNYYKDKVKYIVSWEYETDILDDFILDDEGNPIVINPPYTNVTGYGLDVHAKEPERAKNANGSDKTQKKKGWYKNDEGKMVRGTYEVAVWSSSLTNLNKAYINQKYTIEAYGVKNGLELDPQWSQYSPEEILQMEDDGVDIPQEILDIAHTIAEGSGENYEGGEDEEGAGNLTTERETFLELIPKAEKHIDKLNKNREKIDNKIDDMLQENQKSQKGIFSKQKEQLEELKEYENKIREWRHLQDKINNGEELTDSEARKYAQITGMLQDRNSKSKDFGLDKNKITLSLNEINILAILGEKLADETIEIGDQLADYISQDNYKRTRDEVMGEVGMLRGIVAMSNGKSLAKETSVMGNEAKEYTEEATGTVRDIAGVLGTQQMLSNPNAVDATDTKEPTEVKQAENETAVEGEGTTTPKTTDDDKQTEDEAVQEKNNTDEEDFIINDENVLNLIKEDEEINADLTKEIKEALDALKIAKDDKDFAKSANKVIDKMVQEFEKEEQKRQEEIKTKEQENKEAQERIDELKEEGNKESEKAAEKYDVEVKEGEDNENSENKTEIEEKQKIINQNNKYLEAIRTESKAAREEFKQNTRSTKESLAQSIPEEIKARKRDAQYKDEIIPEAVERLAFTNSSGGTLYKMGKYRITVGVELLTQALFAPHLRELGMYHITKGNESAAIGAEAQKISNSEIPKIADKTTTSSVENEGQAIDGLNEIDVMISSVTGEQTEAEKVAATEEDDKNTEGGENTEEGADDTEGAENIEAGESSEDANTTGETRAVTLNAAQTSAINSVTDETAEPAAPVEGEKPTDKTEETPKENPEEKAEEVADDIENPENTEGTDTNQASKSSKKEEEKSPEQLASDATKQEGQLKKSTDKQEKELKDINRSGKADAKESKKIEKDEKKDAKQLEKEGKNLEAEIKKEEQEMIKLIQESLAAAQKQAEYLARYEALVAENEAIATEEESKQNSAPVQTSQPQQNAQQYGMTGGATTVAGGVTVINSAQGSTADNQ